MNCVIRKIDIASATVTTLTGNPLNDPALGFSDLDTTLAAANWVTINFLEATPTGVIYAIDSTNSLRRISGSK